MKKILTSLVATALLTLTANADLTRLEMGAGMWQQTPTGSVHASTTEESDLLNLSGDYNSLEKDSNEMYLWMLIKHPIPILPNLRLEYVSTSDEGTTDGDVNGQPTNSNASPTTIDMHQFDIIPYYNILDNTAWITLDIGVDIKVVKSDAYVSDLAPTSGFLDTSYTSNETIVLPLLYLRTRLEIPATNIGLEADVKYITYDGSTVYDVRAKVDYTLDFFPVVQPAIEVGYRTQKIDLEEVDTENTLNFEFSGVYAGVMVRF